MGSAGRRERGGAAGLSQPHVVRAHGGAHGRAPHAGRDRALAGQPRECRQLLCPQRLYGGGGDRCRGGCRRAQPVGGWARRAGIPLRVAGGL